MYHCKGRPYLHLTGWERNQQIRAKKPKYPRPEEADEELPEINCNQAQADESKLKQTELPDGKENQPNADDPVVVEMVLNDGGTYKVTRSEAERYQALYPAVDVMQELRNAAGWLEGNPTRRKRKLESSGTSMAGLRGSKTIAKARAEVAYPMLRHPTSRVAGILLRGDGYGR